MDLNFEVLETLTKCLRIKLDYSTTTEFFKKTEENVLDYRFLANVKKDNSEFEVYPQVFDDKHGFINNLSILDLLFNEGKFTIDYLKNQKMLGL